MIFLYSPVFQTVQEFRSTIHISTKKVLVLSVADLVRFTFCILTFTFFKNLAPSTVSVFLSVLHANPRLRPKQSVQIRKHAFTNLILFLPLSLNLVLIPVLGYLFSHTTTDVPRKFIFFIVFLISILSADCRVTLSLLRPRFWGNWSSFHQSVCTRSVLSFLLSA